jgi:hypothetical protein
MAPRMRSRGVKPAPILLIGFNCKLELSLNAIHTPTNVLDRRRLGKVVKGIALVAQIYIHKKKLSLVKKRLIVQVIV